MKDSELRSQADYSEGQKEAAQRILIEIANLLNDFQDNMLIIGGWVPDLLFPDLDHIGSIDVDILFNHLNLAESSYENIERILTRNGYRKHPEKFFTFIKTVIIDEISYDVDLDILAGRYGGTPNVKTGKHFQGIKALKATGGNFAFEVPSIRVKVESKRPDGAYDTASINVISIVPYLVMKTAALGRGKPKDAYDIYFCIKNYTGGIKALADEFKDYLEHGLVKGMIEKLSEKFSSPEHSGPVDVASFKEISDDDELDIVKRDAYEQVNSLIELLI